MKIFFKVYKIIDIFETYNDDECIQFTYKDFWIIGNLILY